MTQILYLLFTVYLASVPGYWQNSLDVNHEVTPPSTHKSIIQNINTVLCWLWTRLWYMLPHFDYCDIVWWSSSNTLITRVTKRQNRCARVLTSSGRYSRITPLYQRLNLITFKDRLIFHKAVLYWTVVYKDLNGLVPQYLSSSFSRVQHRYSTRRMASAALQYPRLRLECFRNSLKYSGVQIWNPLPDSIKCANSLAQFKHRYFQRSF